MFIPTGYIVLREAVVRLADARSPDAKVRQYLSPAPRRMPEGLSGPAQFRWAMSPPPDPWQRLRRLIGSPGPATDRADAEDPAQAAPMAAMGELRQAFWAGELAAVAKFRTGYMLPIDRP
jgi:hypothetical protein